MESDGPDIDPQNYTQSLLIDFLLIEAATGLTLLNTAALAPPEHLPATVKNIRQALSLIRKFAVRVLDLQAYSNIQDRADKLESGLNEFLQLQPGPRRDGSGRTNKSMTLERKTSKPPES